MGGVLKELNPSVLPLSSTLRLQAIQTEPSALPGFARRRHRPNQRLFQNGRVRRASSHINRLFPVPIHKLPSRQAQSEVMDGRGLSVAKVTAVNLTPSNRASPSRTPPQVAVPGLGNGLDEITGKALFDLPKPRVKTGKRLRCPGSWPGTRQRQGQQGGEGTRKGGRV